MAAAKEHTSAVKEYLDTPEPQPYVWSFPGAPIRIHLSLEVVERLTLRFRVNNGAASFGLLLGRADGLITTVSGVLPLASAEAAEIERALTKLAAASGRSSAVGFYRSQPSSQQQEGSRRMKRTWPWPTPSLATPRVLSCWSSPPPPVRPAPPSFSGMAAT